MMTYHFPKAEPYDGVNMSFVVYHEHTETEGHLRIQTYISLAHKANGISVTFGLRFGASNLYNGVGCWCKSL